ncbi:MAG: hypothetical protein IPI81_12605 [Flavobacteriales bacterium]|nr:hypothetical protein [Flavobacteriales bacterium]MCC6937576.1 hypothetical protein [Flavobacteriales bacterium]
MATPKQLGPEGYLKGLLDELLSGRVDWSEPKPPFELGGHRIIPDGRFGKEWVVELEARTLKQVRGALVDLTISDRPKKLLVVLFKPTDSMSASSVEQHLNEVVERMKGPKRTWCIIALTKEGSREKHLESIKKALLPHGLVVAKS